MTAGSATRCVFIAFLTPTTCMPAAWLGLGIGLKSGLGLGLGIGLGLGLGLGPHAVRLCGAYAGERVLEGEALGGRHAELLRGEEVGEGVRLVLRALGVIARQDELEGCSEVERLERLLDVASVAA
eukprot:scaffold86391_cov60-Phaeocystis_antarctica.AAC.6